MKQVSWDGGGEDLNGNHVAVRGSGQRQLVTAVDAIQFLFSAGNVEDGKFVLYGVR